MFKNLALPWIHSSNLANFFSKTTVKQVINLALQNKKYCIFYRGKKSLGNSENWKENGSGLDSSSQAFLHWHPWDSAADIRQAGNSTCLNILSQLHM